MTQLNNKKRLDNSSRIGQDNPNETMNAKKSPWFLRWPAAVRQRLNQWNWRQKTALVTALAITTAGTFAYQYKVNAAWPAVLAVAGGKDWLVKLFAGYAITQGLNAAFDSSILKETAVADSDTWLYSKRKLRVRGYEYDEGGNRTLIYSVDAQAEAAQDKTYDTSGTDTRYSPSTLDADDVIDYVDSNANLRRGMEVTYAVLVLRNGSWVPLFTWDRRKPEIQYLETYTDTYGGYVKPLTDTEIQEDLDKRRRVWNRYGRGRYTVPGSVGPLKKGHVVGRVYNSYTCEKEVKLWSDFEHVAVPGSNDLSPTELEEQGNRSTYVTRFSYIAREAGFIYNIRTKVPPSERPRHDYPEPMSWCDDNFKRFALTKIPWSNFKIIGTPAWVGRAKRYFKHKKITQWCLDCNYSHPPSIRRNLPNGVEPCNNYTTKHEYPVYQNENVIKP